MRSKYEKKIAKDLQSRGIEYEYETYSYEYYEPVPKQRRVGCNVCGSNDIIRIGTYTPDFFFNGETLIVEAKGRFTAQDRRKMLAVKEAWPNLNLRMIFMTDNKIHKNSQTRYSDWCEKHGFEYTIGTEIPDKWITLATQ